MESQAYIVNQCEWFYIIPRLFLCNGVKLYRGVA